MQNIKHSLIAKAIQVIESCETIDQLKTAERYAELATKASLSPAYIQLVQAAEDYFIIKKEINYLIEMQQNKL